MSGSTTTLASATTTAASILETLQNNQQAIIIGVTVGLVALLVIIVVTVICCCCRKAERSCFKRRFLYQIKHLPQQFINKTYLNANSLKKIERKHDTAKKTLTVEQEQR